ncbi:MAG: sigma-54-dependent Fis family transcriptional regulator [Deltaproteobacteria bacterium]|nr:sigma-54-dependent Fis family transcriptional regulator [Deltaproteobacteria bacterium]
MERPRLLIVDDELSVRESLRMILKERFQPVLATCGEQALELLATEPVDVVLLDILMPGLDGLETLERIAQLKPPPPVIMLTATKTVKTAVNAMKLGAFDYITKPFDIDELFMQIERAVQSAALLHEVETLRTEVGRRYSFDNIVGGSAKMQAVLKTVAMAAPLKTTVLITGESGTGKEVIAKAIHYNSPRANKPLVTLNCSAIPDNLLESELFGHERGAFTDAYAKKIGQFEHADQGTIFLDEIGEMNPATQAKILRVLEQSTFTRVGGVHPVQVDVRVIAATNRDLQQGMREGTFRSDLYYRLNVIAIHLPPLRDRREDLAPLIRHFLKLKARDLGVAEKAFSSEALDRLLEFDWPGNVRELENVIERALVLSASPVMTPDDLPQNLTSGNSQAHPTQLAVARGEKRLSEAVDKFEQDLIRNALAEAHNNQTRAAEILGTTRRILKYKMDKLGIQALDKGPE